MNNYLVIGFVIFMVIRYFYTISKANFEIRNIKEHEIADTDNQLSIENSIEIDRFNEEVNILDNELLYHPAISKNTFLYPDAEFAKEVIDKSNYVSIISIDDYDILANVSLSKENINELNESNEATDRAENEKTIIVQTSKNKWLYPDDEFGKMERGRSF